MSMRSPTLNSYTAYSSFAGGASRAHEAGARSRHHLKRALAEIDGLFAGLNYLDKAEPCQDGPSGPSSQTPESESIDALQLELDSFSSESAAPPTSEKTTGSSSQRRDWSAIRNVRDGMEAVWKEFELLVTKLDIDVVKNIREQYRDAKGLQKAGVFAFRNTVTGSAPNNLEKIFAFTSLSYVVSCLLRDRGRLQGHDVLDGVQIWYSAIQTQEERDAFIRVARELWPEASDHLHMIPPTMSDENARVARELRSQGRWAGPSNVDIDEGNNTNANDVPETSWIEAAGISAVSDLDAHDAPEFCDNWPTPTRALENNIYQMTDGMEQEFGFNEFIAFECGPPDIGQDGSIFPTLTPNTNPVLPLDTGQWNYQTDSAAPIEQNHATNGPSKDMKVSVDDLRGTKLFKVFLIFFHYLDTFLYDLSGGGMTTSKDIQQLLAYQEKEWMDRIYDDLLRRLLNDADSKDLRYQAIILVAERFVKLGYLQEVEEVQAYLFSIGKKIIDDSSYKHFFRWVSDSERKRDSTFSPTSQRRPNGGIRKRPVPVGRFSCNHCGRKFSTKFNMRRHQQTTHTSQTHGPEPRTPTIAAPF